MAKATVSAAKVLQTIKAKSKGAFKKSKKKEVVVKGSTLPSGLNNAIAILSSYKLALDKNQNPYMAITGIVVEPQELAGARCTKMYPLYASTGQYAKSVEERWDKLCNDLKLMGGEDCLDDCESEDDVPGKIDELIGEKAAYRFNTWKPDKKKKTDPEPNVQIMIQGQAEDYEAPADEEVEEEEEATEEETEEEETTPPKKPAKKPVKKPAKPVEEEETEEETEEEEAAEEEEASEEEGWTPEKGQIYLYKSNPKLKADECTVLKVNEEEQTMTLKRMKDSKIFKDVAWDAIEMESE